MPYCHKICLKTPYLHILHIYGRHLEVRSIFLAKESTGEKETEGHENVANIHLIEQTFVLEAGIKSTSNRCFAMKC